MKSELRDPESSLDFYRPRVAVAGLDLTLSVVVVVTKTQISHLEALYAESVQSKDV